MTTQEFHRLAWDAAHVARFWDFASSSPAFARDYFSRQVGVGLATFIRRLAPRASTVLDFGCGPGYLAEQLVRVGMRCGGCDSSPASVAAANARLGGAGAWQGALAIGALPLPYADGAFDLVVACETLEHLLPGDIDGLLAEWRRILAPGRGRLLVTTPNGEDLALAEVGCPGCGAVFHRFQHLRSFDGDALAALLEAHGFVTELCGATDFMRFQPPAGYGRGIAAVARRMRQALRALARGTCGLIDALPMCRKVPGGRWLRAQLGDGPHLFWLGTRS